MPPLGWRAYNVRPPIRAAEVSIDKSLKVMNAVDVCITGQHCTACNNCAFHMLSNCHHHLTVCCFLELVYHTMKGTAYILSSLDVLAELHLHLRALELNSAIFPAYACRGVDG